MSRKFLQDLGLVTVSHLVSPAEVDQPPKEPTPPIDGNTTDAWEGWYGWHEEGDLPVRVEATIRYVDAEGRETKRRITTRRFGPDKDGYTILAHCHLRQQFRTFKTSRIHEFIDALTGEVVGDVPLYLRRVYDASPIGRTANLLKEAASELVVLLYVARADARLSSKEKAIIVAFLRRTAPHLELDMTSVDFALTGEPLQAALKRALKMVLDNGRAEAILSDVEALGAARGKMDDVTDAAIRLVGKRPRIAAPIAAVQLVPLHSDFDRLNKAEEISENQTPSSRCERSRFLRHAIATGQNHCAEVLDGDHVPKVIRTTRSKKPVH